MFLSIRKKWMIIPYLWRYRWYLHTIIFFFFEKKYYCSLLYEFHLELEFVAVRYGRFSTLDSGTLKPLRRKVKTSKKKIMNKCKIACYQLPKFNCWGFQIINNSPHNLKISMNKSNEVLTKPTIHRNILIVNSLTNPNGNANISNYGRWHRLLLWLIFIFYTILYMHMYDWCECEWGCGMSNWMHSKANTHSKCSIWTRKIKE